MAEERIIQALTQVVTQVLSSGVTGVPPWRVCTATLDEWDEFQQSENYVLKTSRMEWIDGVIYIVELPLHENEQFALNLGHLISPSAGVVNIYLNRYGAAYAENHPDGQPAYEPDESYGPARATGSHLPHDVESFWDWRTLVVEVGFKRTWGTTDGLLDWKAQKWAGVPGVCFILCVAVTRRLATAEYKLYRVYRPRRLRACCRLENPNEPPVSIVPPRTEVHFDARTLLGLEPGDPLPRDPPNDGAEFPDPLVVDLYQVLVRAQRLFNV
ncbi:hypothetical protein DVH05_000724 [Phytophthora capsici]|nr:hypothetical protein DVH05_000724 [Phytophthora capsici]